jgi:hypothetical protein
MHRDLAPDLFREHGHKTVDWITDYLENMNSYPVLARTKPGETKSHLPISPPEKPEPVENHGLLPGDYRRIVDKRVKCQRDALENISISHGA